jgi:hypothetical protein
MSKIVRTLLCMLALGLSIPVIFAGAPNQNQTSQPQAIGQSAAAEMQAVQSAKDIPAEMHNAVVQLQGAKADLEKAGGEWGGHRKNALNHVNEALKEINLAADYAHKHGTY